MKDVSKARGIKGKIVLLRSDINSDYVDGKIINSERIKSAAQTIEFLRKKGAKVVVISHQGRPKKEGFTSLKEHSKFLNKYTKIKFIKDVFGKLAESEIKSLNKGEAILLENLRFYKEEFEDKKNKLVKNLSNWCDIYVNDAFSNSHRKHASIVALPRFMESYAGPLLIKEVEALKKIKLRQTVYVLGGAKPEDNIRLLGKNKVLACGLFGQMCLAAKGFKFGAQEKYLRKEFNNYNSIIKKLKRKLKNVETPVDFAVKIDGKRKELTLEDFPSEYEIFDIGGETIEIYSEKMVESKSVYMKGPAGFCGHKEFCKGTNSLLKAISICDGFSLIGGGHLSDAISKSGIKKEKFGHISLSGGALLRYVAGEKLPGIEALK